MKECPECQTQYPIEEEICPQDGAALVLKPPLVKNPTIEEVVQVTPQELTAVVDLEKMEAARLKQEEASRLAAEAHDPEATGTILAEQIQSIAPKSAADVPVSTTSSALENEALYSDIEGFPEAQETVLTRVEQETEVRDEPTAATVVAPTEKKTKTAALVIGAAAVILVFLATLFFFNNNRPSAFGAPLLITSVPTNAEVWIDSRRVGETPLQLVLSPGFYDVELKKDGFNSLRDIVELQGQGLSVSKALIPKGSSGPSPQNTGADKLLEQFYADLSAGRIATATTTLKSFLRLYPDDERGLRLIQELGKRAATTPPSSNKAKRSAKVNAPKVPWRARLNQAESLIRSKKIAAAKSILSDLLAEKPGAAQPHRLLARIASSSNDLKTTRYHLQRYLKLGGADDDGQVQKWLRENPPK